MRAIGSGQDDEEVNNSAIQNSFNMFPPDQSLSPFNMDTNNCVSASSTTQRRSDIPPPIPGDNSHQNDMQQFGESLSQNTTFDFQTYDSTAFGAAVPHLAFWEDPAFMAPLYLDPCVDGEDSLVMDLPNDEQSNLAPADGQTGDDSESDQAPMPSFLGARQSPEPQHGQALRLTEFLANVWPDQGRRRDWAGKTMFSDNRSGETLYPPPLMGTFSPILSSTANHQIWEAENLVHVKPLPMGIYTHIVARFKEFNSTSNQYNQFAAGDFPSIAACNAFMQLFFEHFNQLLPIIHQASFDPAQEAWLLVLSVMAIGSRYSQQSVAVECADILQEFVHRAFQATIAKHYDSTCEPWLAQSGLLNQIGMQFSADLRLTEVGQSNRSLVTSICRKVNCFKEADRSIDTLRSLPKEEAWKIWSHRESMSRLAYAVWFVDGQYALYHDLTPIFPTELLRVQLPCPESLWRAPSATTWRNILKQNGKFAEPEPEPEPEMA
ncbi:hypothetical protein LTS17_003220 [Exophiala oligosperma]